MYNSSMLLSSSVEHFIRDTGLRCSWWGSALSEHRGQSGTVLGQSLQVKMLRMVVSSRTWSSWFRPRKWLKERITTSLGWTSSHSFMSCRTVCQQNTRSCSESTKSWQLLAAPYVSQIFGKFKMVLKLLLLIHSQFCKFSAVMKRCRSVDLSLGLLAVIRTAGSSYRESLEGK